MRKRHWTGLVLLTAALFALSASGVLALASSTPITLELWQDNVDEITTGILNDAAAQFEADTGIKVNITYTEAAPYKTKLITAMGSSEVPDIFLTWGGGWLKQFIDEGQVADITDLITDWKGELIEPSWNDLTFGEKVYGIPFNLNGAALYYNKPLFESLNLTVPTTWDELAEVAEVLKANNIIPFAMGNIGKWPGAMHFLTLAMRLGGKDVYTNAEANQGDAFADKSYVRAGEILQQMVTDGWFPEGVNGINYDTGGSRMLFYTGRAAMIYQNTNFPPRALGEAEDFYNNNLAIAAYPTIEGGLGSDGVVCGINAYSISESCENKQAAVDFIRYYVADPTITNRRANEAGSMITYANVQYDMVKRQDCMSLFTDAAFMQNFYDQALPAELGALHLDTTQALIGLSTTPEAAAAEMQSKANELIP